MNKLLLKILVIIGLVVHILYMPTPSFATIAFDANGKWGTTFDCSDVTQPGTVACDGITNWGGVWSFNKYILTDGSTDNWTQSTNNTGEWYYNSNTFDTFSMLASREVWVGNTKYGNRSVNPAPVVGSLDDETFGKGDEDSLGYDTIYIPHATDPDLETNGQVRAYWAFSSVQPDGYASEISADANNTSGLGGKGFRTLDGDGSNIDTGPLDIDFPSGQTEIWVRWYMRHELGYDWYYLDNVSTPPPIIPQGQKHIIIGLTGAQAHYAGFFIGEYDITAQGTRDQHEVTTTSGGGWPTIMKTPNNREIIQDVWGSTVRSGSDGEWHCYEIYMKMDTEVVDGVANGAGRIWIDGVLQAEDVTAGWSGAVGDYNLGQVENARNGWTFLRVGENQSSPDNRGSIMYVDYDDIVVYNTTPPNRDLAGNYFIGPVGATPTPTPSSGTTKNGFGSGKWGR